MAASELMQMEANEGNEAIRLRAASLLALSAAALVLPAVWRPATATSSAADPTGLIVVAADWVAWALTIYLAVGTGVAAAGYLGGAGGSWGRVTPRAVRRALPVVVGASGAAAVCLAPAVAYADTPPPVPAATASPLDWPGLAPLAPAPAVHRAVHREAPKQRHPETRLVVRPGDSLWSLTARQLGPHASTARIAAGWPRLYDANRRVSGADPNLIHPGQRLDPSTAIGPTSDGPTSEAPTSEGTSR